MLLQGKWSITVNTRIEDAWQFIANTDRINRSFDINPVTYKILEDERGGSRLFGRTSTLGMTSEYREFPYEWVQNEFLSVVKEYSKGVIKKLQYEMSIEDQNDRFVCHFYFRVVPRYFILKPFIRYEIRYKSLKNFQTTFKNIENYIRNHTGIAVPGFGFEPRSKNKELLREVEEKFSNACSDKKLVSLLSVYILDTPDSDLFKIKPKKIAKFFGFETKTVLHFFLKGTQLGFFDMNWDILCPDCKGSAASIRKLKDLPEEVHCSSCNIDYGPDFDRNVEITFTPNDSIRRLIGGVYCLGGPMNTPQVKLQLRVKENSERIQDIELDIGVYRLFSPQKKSMIRINVTSNGTEDLIEYGDESLTYEIMPGTIRLILQNSFHYEILVKLEDTSYLLECITASELITMNEYRYQFTTDVLKKGREISVKSIAILFTDLKGSTVFYNEKGDTFAYKIVGDHFDVLFNEIEEYNGAIVKTIGDAIMAVFLNPLDAVNYSLCIQKKINQLNLEYGKDWLRLKIGIHYGPALVVNMNDKLDYFGATVNLAARTEGQCLGNDIVITKKIYDIPEIRELLSKKRQEFFQTELKGFSEALSLVRIFP